MGYDLQLHRKNHQKEPFKAEALEKLNRAFEVEILTKNDEGCVLDFTAKSKRYDSESCEFSFTNDGYYWTYLSYSVSEKDFEVFMKLVDEVATLLEIDIKDPQLTDSLQTPLQHSEELEEGKKRFSFSQKITEGVAQKTTQAFALPLDTPAQGNFFTKYLITATTPSGQRVLLSHGGQQVYCSKVLPGQTLREVIKQEVPELIGAPDYMLVSITDGGIDFDREGNELPRANLNIHVPYFEPDTRVAKYNVVWEILEPRTKSELVGF